MEQNFNTNATVLSFISLKFIHRVLVFPEGHAEKMASIIFRNKIEEVCFCWIQCSLDGIFSWIGNGARGEPAIEICVVGRIKFHILRAKPVPELPDLFEGIDDRGITTQPHLLFETIVKNGGNKSAFLWQRGFLLYQGSQDNNFPYGLSHFLSSFRPLC